MIPYLTLSRPDGHFAFFPCTPENSAVVLEGWLAGEMGIFREKNKGTSFQLCSKWSSFIFRNTFPYITCRLRYSFHVRQPYRLLCLPCVSLPTSVLSVFHSHIFYNLQFSIATLPELQKARWWVWVWRGELISTMCSQYFQLVCVYLQYFWYFVLVMSSSGKLILSVNKDTFEELGLQGTNSKYQKHRFCKSTNYRI